MNSQAPETDRIIRAAASLSERIALSARDMGNRDDSELADSRLSLWLAQSAQGRTGKFDRRLSWQGLDRKTATSLLGQRDAGPFRTEPAWVPMLRDMMDFLDDAPVPQYAIPDFKNPVPFVHALSPLVAFGMETLTSGMASAPLADNIAESVRRHLIELIGDICALTLGEEFERFRRARTWVPGSGQGSTELYDAFIAGIGSARWKTLFGIYPVLARLIATRIGDWASDTAEFLDRLNNDIPGIELRFFAGRALPPVLSIESSLSDPHDCGRAVRIATFEDGRKIVYKPRSLALDEAWMNLALWLAQTEDFFRIRAPLVWNHASYGWAEFIEHYPCADLEGVRGFYRRAGMLTCLLYAIRGSDFHRGNLIASGEDPTPVDLETLFVPDMKTLALVSGEISKQFLETILQTFVLPSWMSGADGKTAFDISGLGSFAADQAPGQGDGWTSVNTDAMRYENRALKLLPSHNLASIGGEPVDPIGFVPEIAEGFQRAYRALVRHRDALLAPDGPIEAFRGCPGRVVLRGTQIYVRMLRRSLAPRFLRNGIDRSLEFEALSRPFLAPDQRYDGSRIFLAELGALERLDIPRFDVQPELDSLGLGKGARLEAVLDAPALPGVVERLGGFNEEDLDYQLELIRSSFAARDLRLESLGRRCEEIAPVTHTAAPVAAVTMDGAELIARARRIADRIARRTIWDADVARWLGVDFNPAINRCSIQPLSASLYSGRAGIALFFAAMHSVGGGDPEHRRIAIGAARSVRQDFWGPGMDTDSTATAAQSCGIGMGSGLAGIAYALLTCARLLDDPGLVGDAVRVGQLINEKLIAEDGKLDVMAGAAGSIFGLFQLWEASGDQVFLNRLAICADRLVSHQLTEDENRGGWMTLAPRPLAGFAHGAAGMALALTRASRATGISSYQDSARRAIAYERSVFLPAEDNWSDFREQARKPPVAAWCHGAPGIGLARLGCLAGGTDDRALDEIETVARWLHTNAAGPFDHLCCGELGKLEVLLEAGRRLSRPEWVDAGRRRAAAVIARADQDRCGFYSMIGSTESMFIPGFFNGLAGIGYQMLRLADMPGRLRSVLLWD